MQISDNPLNDWNNHCAEEERLLQKRPICLDCGEHIADAFCYEIGGEHICIDCMEQYHLVEVPEEQEK